MSKIRKVLAAAVDMSKIRKALAAAVAAAGAMAWGQLQAGGFPRDALGWSALVGSAVTAGGAAGWAAWRIPNAK